MEKQYYWGSIENVPIIQTSRATLCVYKVTISRNLYYNVACYLCYRTETICKVERCPRGRLSRGGNPEGHNYREGERGQEYRMLLCHCFYKLTQYLLMT